MRTILSITLASAALLVVSCKATDKAEANASGEITSAFATALAFGGQHVDAGDHKVELRVFEDGRAEALVTDARGNALPAPEGAKVTLHATAKGAAPDAKTPIELAWDPVTARFAGKAAGGAALDARPIDVDVSASGATAHGTLATPVLLVGPEIGGTLFVADKYGVELSVRGDGETEAIVRDAAGAKVSGDLKLAAKLATAGGASSDVKLAWDPPRGRFVGKAAADAKLAAGPAEVSIDGKLAAKLPKVALHAHAAHGGRMIAAGDYSVELVAKGDVVNAFVFDAAGAAVATADLDLSLRFGTGGFVKLAWDAPSLSYKVDVAGAADLDVAPVTVAVKTKGNGKAMAFVGMSAPHVDANANAHANAHANAKADLHVPDLHGKAEAKADVKPPILKAKAEVKPPGGEAKGGAAAKAGFSLGTK